MSRFAAGLLAAGVLVTGARPAHGQGFDKGTLVAPSWEVGFPSTGLRSYVNAASLQGVALDVRWGWGRRISLGLTGSWNWFAQNYPEVVTYLPNGAVSGPVYNRVQFLGARATGHWYLSRAWLQPFVGAGVGGTWFGTYRQTSDLVSTTSGFAFTADPEVGVLCSVGPGLAILIQGRYQFTLAGFAGVKNAQWIGLDVGLALY